MFSLSNKVAIVTGASRGIGKVIAQIFANAGAHVICVARSENAIKSLANEINSDGGSASHFACDISDGEAFSNLISTTAKEHGKLDILINNAGVTRDSLLMRMKEDQWDEVLNINLKGAFHGMKAAIRPMMKNRSGRIINITSIHDVMPYPNNLDYNMSKAALNMFSKTLAVELGPMGIRVNNLAPGPVETDINREVIEELGRDNFAEIGRASCRERV